MGKSTVYAGLYGFIPFLYKLRVSGAHFHPVQRAVAKKTVNLIASLMAGIILTVSVFEISV